MNSKYENKVSLYEDDIEFSPDGAKHIADDLTEGLLRESKLPSAVVRSEYGFTFPKKGFYNRLFFEVTNPYIPYVINRYWPNADQLFPIEGYLLEPNHIELFTKWNERPRDDLLFKNVMNQVQCAFYTIGGQHRHFVFVTNKWTIKDLEDKVHLQALRMMAKDISERS
jgi:hypothetical protein